MQNTITRESVLPEKVLAIVAKFNHETKNALEKWAFEYKNQFQESFDEQKRDTAFDELRAFESDPEIFEAIIKIQKIIRQLDTN